MNRTDQELIAAIKKGEKEPARILYERHYSFTLKIALKILRSFDDAMDITQEVFMLILVKNKIADFRGESQFSSWLYRITTNKSLTFLRGKQRQREKNVQDFQNYLETHQCPLVHPTQLHRLESVEKTESIHRALKALPSQYGRCVYLRYFEGHKYKEIASDMNITQDRVGMQIMRSKNLLHKNKVLQKIYLS